MFVIQDSATATLLRSKGAVTAPYQALMFIASLPQDILDLQETLSSCMIDDPTPPTSLPMAKEITSAQNELLWQFISSQKSLQAFQMSFNNPVATLAFADGSFQGKMKNICHEKTLRK